MTLRCISFLLSLVVCAPSLVLIDCCRRRLFGEPHLAPPRRYVEREFSDETSKIMPDCKIWVTNRYQHSGLREDGDKVLDTLLGMTRGEIELPS